MDRKVWGLTWRLSNGEWETVFGTFNECGSMFVNLWVFGLREVRLKRVGVGFGRSDY